MYGILGNETYYSDLESGSYILKDYVGIAKEKLNNKNNNTDDDSNILKKRGKGVANTGSDTNTNDTKDYLDNEPQWKIDLIYNRDDLLKKSGSE